MTILKEWLANRGVFDDVKFGETELEIVSLNKKLIEELKVLPTYEMMFEFVAEHGLSDERNRLSEDENHSKDIPAIWLIPDFIENKLEIVDAICELSGITEILTDKKEEEELEAIEKEEAAKKAKEEIFLNGDGKMPLDMDMGTVKADMEAHNNINK